MRKKDYQYLEFQKGKCSERIDYWREDSRYIDLDSLSETGLPDCISNVAENFCEFGIIAISKSEWEMMREPVRDTGGVLINVINELRPWANDNFRTEEYFTILGV